MTKKFVVPSHEQVQKAGTGLEITGIIIAGLCLAVGLISAFGSGSAVWLLGTPFGILLVIAGYTKRSAEASMATFIALTQDSEESAAKDELSA